MTNPLEHLLKTANGMYHGVGEPIMTDEVYDGLLESLQRQQPGTLRPWAQVGTPAVFGKTPLPVWMGSLDKIKNGQHAAIAKWAAAHPGKVAVSDKLDGVSALIDGGRMLTRGNGRIGENVSFALSIVRGIPAETPQGLLIRGELVIEASVQKNARNSIVGALRSEGVSRTRGDAAGTGVSILRQTDFVAHELVGGGDIFSQLEGLQRLGFKVPWYTEMASLQGLEELLLERKRLSPYDVDGLVVHSGGEHGRADGENPSYAFAYKSSSINETFQARVLSVEWNVSKHGLVKPTVTYEPHSLSNGVNLSRASGFNAAFIRDSAIGPGAVIEVMRSGDVIPHIVRTVTPASAPSMPTIPCSWGATGVDLVCDPGEHSGLARMQSFFKRLGAAGLGNCRVAELYAAGYVTPGAIIGAQADDIAKHVGRQTAITICASVRVAISRARCVDIMVGSCIFGQGIGDKKLGVILRAHPGFMTEELDASSLALLEGLGPLLAERFVAALPAFRTFVAQNSLSYACARGGDFILPLNQI
jgi:NAD-dependent DNA ligase